MRKNTKGISSQVIDALAWEKLVEWLLTKNPTSLFKSIAMKSIDAYNKYLNENTSMDRKGFLRDFQNEYGESFLEYLLKNNKKLTPELIKSIEDSEMDTLIDTLYGGM